MTISVGDRLPDLAVTRATADGPQQVQLGELTKGRKVVLFAVPGAFTPTCHKSHMPSFVRTSSAFKAQGIDEILCVATNDPFVMRAWAAASGADEAGIGMLSDEKAALTIALGLEIAPAQPGQMMRSKRYSMLVDDGVVRELQVEESPGSCEISAGDSLLERV